MKKVLCVNNWKNEILKKTIFERDIVNGSLINLFDVTMRQSNTDLRQSNTDLRQVENHRILPGT
jgi:hypothetical protein